MKKNSKGTHNYFGALAQALSNCHPYEINSGILVGEKNWVEQIVETSAGTRKHSTLFF